MKKNLIFCIISTCLLQVLAVKSMETAHCIHSNTQIVALHTSVVACLAKHDLFTIVKSIYDYGYSNELSYTLGRNWHNLNALQQKNVHNQYQFLYQNPTYSLSILEKIIKNFNEFLYDVQRELTGLPAKNIPNYERYDEYFESVTTCLPQLQELFNLIKNNCTIQEEK
jgi:hypothetical protein